MTEKEIEQLKIDRAILLAAVQEAYLKHHCGDESIGWGELSETLHTALCEVMGDKGYQEFLKTCAPEGE